MGYAVKPACVLSFSAMLCACGGGGTSGLDKDTQTDAIELGNTLVSGTVVVEERGGKTVFDGWFTQTSAAEISAVPSDNAITNDVCDVSSVHSNNALDTPVQMGAANSDLKYTSVGNALTIESRVGEFEALIQQQASGTIVYAPENRWQSAELPDDAVLSFEAGTLFTSMDAVRIPRLMPLVWLAPETGVMPSAAASLRWEASFDEQVQIMLKLSAIDFSDSENPVVVTVACSLIDDGLFTLPAQYQQQLPDDDMGIVVYAVRERVQQINGEDARLTVVQLSYPAPIVP